jgi:hypothetical protein
LYYHIRSQASRPWWFVFILIEYRVHQNLGTKSSL